MGVHQGEEWHHQLRNEYYPSYWKTINMAAFRGELNWALRVVQLGYQRSMKRHLAPVVLVELGLIRRISARK